MSDASFTYLGLPTLQTSSRLTQPLCPQAARVGSQCEDHPSHSHRAASQAGSGLTNALGHPQLHASAQFVSRLPAGYFPL